jgi:hypothetical protein
MSLIGLGFFIFGIALAFGNEPYMIIGIAVLLGGCLIELLF